LQQLAALAAPEGRASAQFAARSSAPEDLESVKRVKFKYFKSLLSRQYYNILPHMEETWLTPASKVTNKLST
jgi:hypothetical protein